MSIFKKLFIVLSVGVFVVGLSACPERAEKPAEEAGEAVKEGAERPAKLWKKRPLLDLDRQATGGPVQFYRDWLQHDSPTDPWWTPMNFRRNITEVEKPVTMTAGWWDIFTPGQIDDFVAMREKRDATLAAPMLLLPSIQVNIRAGKWPVAESNGVRYLKIPIRLAS